MDLHIFYIYVYVYIYIYISVVCTDRGNDKVSCVNGMEVVRPNSSPQTVPTLDASSCLGLCDTWGALSSTHVHLGVSQISRRFCLTAAHDGCRYRGFVPIVFRVFVSWLSEGPSIQI